MGPNHALPQELASNAMVLLGKTLVVRTVYVRNKIILLTFTLLKQVFGGTGFPFGVNCSNRLYVCQPGKKPKEMTEMEVKGDLPPAQYGQAIVYHDGHLYTIGGTEGFDYTCDIYR